MKHRLIAISFLLGLLAAAGKAPAQTITFKAHVPFPFVIGNQTLPAGTYQIHRLMGRPGEADQIGMLVVRNNDFPVVAVYRAVVTNLVPQPLDSRSSTQLVFDRRSGQRCLSEVRIEGEKGHQIPDVPRESELATSDPSQEEIVAALH
jgi:hypothetical protein